MPGQVALFFSKFQTPLILVFETNSHKHYCFCTIFQFFCLLRYVKGSFSFCLSDPTFGQAYNVVSNDLEFIHEQISKTLKWGKKYFIEILHTDTTHKKRSKVFKEIFHILKFDKLQVLGTAGKKFLPPPCLPKYMFKTFDLCIEVSSHILIN